MAEPRRIPLLPAPSSTLNGLTNKKQAAANRGPLTNDLGDPSGQGPASTSKIVKTKVKESDEGETRPTLRFSFKLPAPTAWDCPTFSYQKLVKEKLVSSTSTCESTLFTILVLRMSILFYDKRLI